MIRNGSLKYRVEARFVLKYCERNLPGLFVFVPIFQILQAGEENRSNPFNNCQSQTKGKYRQKNQ